MVGPNLEDASLFVAVAEAGGFRAASARTGVSASALSDAVRRLEEALGTRLLNRTTRSVTPTEAGARLLERLGPALADIAGAFDGLGGDGGEPSGRLRLNVPGVVARHILPPIVAGFLVAHPRIRVEIVAEDGFVDVLQAGFDAGVRYEERLALDMIAIPIGPSRQRYVAAAAPSYLAARGVPKHPHDLLGHARIGHRFADSRATLAWEFERDGSVEKIPIEGQLVSSAVEIEIAAAVAGLGVIYTFEEFLARELEQGALVPILEDWSISFSGPRLYYHGRRHMPAALRAFVDFIKARQSGAARHTATRDR